MKIWDEPVSRMMSTPVVTVEPRAHVGDVLNLAQQLDIHHFPIVDAEGLFGIVCTCDLQGARPEQAVSLFARRNAVTVSPNKTARQAAATMMEHGVGSVVVVDQEGVWGILTREDLVETAPQLLRNAQCAECNGRRHLHRAQSGAFICAACEARVNADTDAISSQ